MTSKEPLPTSPSSFPDFPHLSTKPPLRIGVLLLPPVQLLDLSPIDLFTMLAPWYLKACTLPEPIFSLGVDTTIYYIAPSGPGTSVDVTSCIKIPATTSLSDDAIQPGKLDILLIPRPDPSRELAEKEGEFIRGHVKSKDTVVMSVCTGIFPLAKSGSLKGKKVTGPRGIQGILKKEFPDTEWIDKRWAKDGNIWTSGGITNGADMVAAYLKEKYPGVLSDTICALADVGDRGVEYGSSSSSANAWWFLLVMRAAVRSVFGKK